MEKLNRKNVWIAVCLVLFLLLCLFVGLKVKYKAKYEREHKYLQIQQRYSAELEQSLSSERNLSRLLREQNEQLRAELKRLNADVEAFKIIGERLKQGVDRNEAYKLLLNREQYAKPLVLKLLGLSKSSVPSGDEDLWNRGQQIYEWLSDNYVYQGDKSMQFGPSMASMQYFSPDELLADDNARGGDCDDYAMLFAGLMLASGVPNSKVRVVIGPVNDDGWHAWNEIKLSSGWYRVDPVCSQEEELFNVLGLSWGVKGASYPNSPAHVQCFDEYDSRYKFNDEAFSEY